MAAIEALTSPIVTPSMDGYISPYSSSSKYSTFGRTPRSLSSIIEATRMNAFFGSGSESVFPHEDVGIIRFGMSTLSASFMFSEL